MIDVLVLAHNGLETTRRFVDALYANTRLEDFTLTLLVNGSTDGTEEWARRRLEAGGFGGPPTSGECNFFLRVSYENLGVIGGRNRLWDDWLNADEQGCTLGDHLLFLDNDQFVKPGWVDAYAALFDEGYDVVGVEAWQMAEDFKPVRRARKVDDWFSYVGCGGMMVRPGVLREIGFFDDQFNPAYFEDPDFCFRAFEAGFRIGWLGDECVDHLGHQTLGRMEWRKLYRSSLAKFRKKWAGVLPPRHEMGRDIS